MEEGEEDEAKAMLVLKLRGYCNYVMMLSRSFIQPTIPIPSTILHWAMNIQNPSDSAHKSRYLQSEQSKGGSTDEGSSTGSLSSSAGELGWRGSGGSGAVSSVALGGAGNSGRHDAGEGGGSAGGSGGCAVADRCGGG